MNSEMETGNAVDSHILDSAGHCLLCLKGNEASEGGNVGGPARSNFVYTSLIMELFPLLNIKMEDVIPKFLVSNDALDCCLLSGEKKRVKIYLCSGCNFSVENFVKTIQQILDLKMEIELTFQEIRRKILTSFGNAEFVRQLKRNAQQQWKAYGMLGFVQELRREIADKCDDATFPIPQPIWTPIQKDAGAPPVVEPVTPQLPRKVQELRTSFQCFFCLVQIRGSGDASPIEWTSIQELCVMLKVDIQAIMDRNVKRSEFVTRCGLQLEREELGKFDFRGKFCINCVTFIGKVSACVVDIEEIQKRRDEYLKDIHRLIVTSDANEKLVKAFVLRMREDLQTWGLVTLVESIRNEIKIKCLHTKFSKEPKKALENGSGAGAPAGPPVPPPAEPQAGPSGTQKSSPAVSPPQMQPPFAQAGPSSQIQPPPPPASNDGGASTPRTLERASKTKANESLCKRKKPKQECKIVNGARIAIAHPSSNNSNSYVSIIVDHEGNEQPNEMIGNGSVDDEVEISGGHPDFDENRNGGVHSPDINPGGQEEEMVIYNPVGIAGVDSSHNTLKTE